MSSAMPDALPASPYPGLRAFSEDEAELFFGREAQTDQLLDRLRRARFLAIVGPSGCGKSSLVRAGMIAALQTGLMADAGAHWRIAQMRPGARPLWRLANALAAPAALDIEGGGGPAALAFADATLRRGPLGLVELLQERWLPAGANLLLLVDQFEEIFRMARLGGAGSGDEADHFVALLLEAASQTATTSARNGCSTIRSAQPDAAIAARAIHPERRDPQWQAHLQRRLAFEGHADLTSMYVQYQQDMRAMLERQPVAHRLLAPH
mgnify:CR=1 FL=1